MGLEGVSSSPLLFYKSSAEAIGYLNYVYALREGGYTFKGIAAMVYVL